MRLTPESCRPTRAPTYQLGEAQMAPVLLLLRFKLFARKNDSLGRLRSKQPCGLYKSAHSLCLADISRFWADICCACAI